MGREEMRRDETRRDETRRDEMRCLVLPLQMGPTQAVEVGGIKMSWLSA